MSTQETPVTNLSYAELCKDKINSPQAFIVSDKMNESQSQGDTTTNLSSAELCTLINSPQALASDKMEESPSEGYTTTNLSSTKLCTFINSPQALASDKMEESPFQGYTTTNQSSAVLCNFINSPQALVSDKVEEGPSQEDNIIELSSSELCKNVINSPQGFLLNDKIEEDPITNPSSAELYKDLMNRFHTYVANDEGIKSQTMVPENYQDGKTETHMNPKEKLENERSNFEVLCEKPIDIIDEDTSLEIKKVKFNNSENEKQQFSSSSLHIPHYDFQNFHLLTFASKEFNSQNCSNNFLKGCKWSPDGTCLLTTSEDNHLRLYDLPQSLYGKTVLTDDILLLPELSSVLKVKNGGTIYDFCWYPYMTSVDPETCCFVSSSSIAPVQLWDAFTGELRSSYRGYDQYDEVVAANSVAFSIDGAKLYCGYHNSVKIFSTDKPGRDYTNINTKVAAGQTGIVSCIAMNSYFQNMFAIGTYNKTIGIYSVDGEALCILKGQMRGLTQIQFSPDGCLLYSGARNDNDIMCWDMRNLGKVLFLLQRNVTTNQRIQFDITLDGKYLISGSTNGYIHVWDTTKSIEKQEGSCTSSDSNLISEWKPHNDCVNGVSIHKHLPLLATSSGQRHAQEICDANTIMLNNDNLENCIKLWWMGPKK
uniref:WD repeat-containing protein 79 n=2 Tax=Clastoptera arizonana TaxID=38151 RepID=A0A1B6D0K4_9HEMI